MNNGPSFSFPPGPSPDNDVKKPKHLRPFQKVQGSFGEITFKMKVFEKLQLIS